MKVTPNLKLLEDKIKHLQQSCILLDVEVHEILGIVEDPSMAIHLPITSVDIQNQNARIRFYNACYRYNIRTIGEFISICPTKLAMIKIRNFGLTTVNAICAGLSKLGIVIEED